ncbi:MAG: putative 4-hydroxybenzoate polyprenyltransferase [Verrucomicrobiota bacterium]|nr:putative 4-hydroxybenzoate polyprenyltransferase [Verrucomicrobiota bacterium]
MIRRILTFVRFSHTVFALPFALGSMFVAARGLPPTRIFALIIVAMVCARTAAMSFNRLVDWGIDQSNPRTASRHKLVPKWVAIVLLCASSAGLVAASWWINIICFALAPVALAIVFFYSLTKRFTSLSHFFLGLALAVSPIGAWLAVAGAFAIPPFVLAAAVLAWVAGFDLIYATQDYEFDRSAGLKSMVVRIGIPRSLRLAQTLHVFMAFGLVAFGFSAQLSLTYFLVLALVAPALIYEHVIARKLDVAAINRAFFNSNAFVGFVFLAAVLIAVLRR